MTYRQAAIDADRAVQQYIGKGLPADHPVFARLALRAENALNDYRRYGDKEKS